MRDLEAALGQMRRMQQVLVEATTASGQAQFTASVWGGLLTATVDGWGALQGLQISPEAVRGRSPHQVSQGIVEAVGEARRLAGEDKRRTLQRVRAMVPGVSGRDADG